MATTNDEISMLSGTDAAVTTEEIASMVEAELAAVTVIDVHTHLFMPSLGRLGLWGIDELLTYHYLEAELFRFSEIKPVQYWGLNKKQQADLIWRTLFVENAPVSEATRGVIAVLNAFGLSTTVSDLMEARHFFAGQDLKNHIGRVLELAGVSEVVMTNDPLDPNEAPLWQNGVEPDERFHPVLRLDRILEMWEANWQSLREQGYKVDREASPQAVGEVRRFLEDWYGRMRPVYMACSLGDTFVYPDDSARTRLLRDAVIPACRDHGIPLSLMIGVRRQVNPAIRLAGDAAGRADLRSLERLCVDFPENRFLTSVLSRENQHELCVYARKFSNLMPFGCWWFLNNPSIVEEITRERLEMLGASFIAQHSDARVLEQVIYKWRNTRRTLAPILANSFKSLAEDGRPVTRADIKAGITRLFCTNFERFVNLRSNHVFTPDAKKPPSTAIH
jgi:hypothetical protein